MLNHAQAGDIGGLIVHSLPTPVTFPYFLKVSCICDFKLTMSCWINYDAKPTSNFQPIRILDQSCSYKFIYLMTNRADPDQLASEEANWSGSTLFAKAGYIRVQQYRCCVHINCRQCQVATGMGNFRINPDWHGISLLHLFARPSFCVRSSYLG